MLNLEKIAGTAVSTAGLIIAASIFTQMIATKYIATFQHFRALSGELRDGERSEERRDSLRHQIAIYERRCHQLRRSSCLMLLSVLAFILTIIAASVSVAFEGPAPVAFAGALTMALGFLGFAAAVVIDVVENRSSRHAIESELHDFDDLDPAGHRLHDGNGSRARGDGSSTLRPREA